MTGVQTCALPICFPVTINDVDKHCYEIQAMLRDKTFVNGLYEVFKKIENGKEREIYKLPYFPDRIVHHAIMQVLEPIWKKR